MSVVYCDTRQQRADIFTKPFTNPTSWANACANVNVMREEDLSTRIRQSSTAYPIETVLDDSDKKVKQVLATATEQPYRVDPPDDGPWPSHSRHMGMTMPFLPYDHGCTPRNYTLPLTNGDTVERPETPRCVSGGEPHEVVLTTGYPPYRNNGDVDSPGELVIDADDEVLCLANSSTELTLTVLAEHVCSIPCFIVQKIYRPLFMCVDQHPAQMRPFLPDKIFSPLSLLLVYRFMYSPHDDISGGDLASLCEELALPSHALIKFASCPESSEWLYRAPGDIAWCILLVACHSVSVYVLDDVAQALFSVPNGLTAMLGIEADALKIAYTMFLSFWKVFRSKDWGFPLYQDWCDHFALPTPMCPVLSYAPHDGVLLLPLQDQGVYPEGYYGNVVSVNSGDYGLYVGGSVINYAFASLLIHPDLTRARLQWFFVRLHKTLLKNVGGRSYVRLDKRHPDRAGTQLLQMLGLKASLCINHIMVNGEPGWPATSPRVGAVFFHFL